MNRLFFISFLLLSISISSSGQTVKELNSTIEEVTVFLSGAQVTRDAGFSLKPGENVFKISNLTMGLDPNSVQVKGNKDYKIMSVKHQINYLEDKSLSPEIESKKDSLEDLQFKLDTRMSLRNAYTEEKSMLLTNKNIKGENAILLAEDLEEMADFFRSRLKEIEYKLLEIRQEEKELSKEIQRINKHLSQLNSRRNVNSSEVLIVLQSNKSVNAKLELSYYVYGAGWIPVYDIRAEDVSNPIELTSKGKVYQSTGNDWEDVMLTLSTGNPAVGGQAPTMSPWYLYLQEIYDQKGVLGKRQLSRNRVLGVQEDADYELTETDLANVVSIAQNTINTEFSISIPYDIPSDNQQYDVETQRLSLNAGYEYLAIPKLDKDAFLLAHVTDWTKHNLLPGESNIYFKGTYVGTGFIDPAITSDTLSLSLGRDQSIVVKREKLTDFCKTSTVGGKKRTTKAFKITVHNTKSKQVKLKLKDQIPLTNTSDIEVTVEETSAAIYNESTGELIWDMTLAAGESKTVELRYTVKYPKKKRISNL